MEDNQEPINNDFQAYSGSKPVPSTDPLNVSYTSEDGRKIYLQFDDPDSTGLSPSTGTQLRFSVTKTFGGSAVTVTPSSTSIISSSPKTLILNLRAADKIVDAYYNAAGIVTSTMFVNVSYNATGFGSTVPLLGDNDNTRSLVDSFVGFGVSNRTVECNGPVLIGATSSYDGLSITAYFREATPPLLPYNGISGFAVSQSGVGLSVLTAYVKDPTSAIDGKNVVISLGSRLSADNGTNPVTLSYSIPSTNILTDSTSVLNRAVVFSGFAVSNVTSEIVKPFVVSAITNTGSIGQTVFLTLSEKTLPNSPSGFTIYKNNTSVSFASTASTTTYLSTVVTRYNFTLIGSTFNNEDQIGLNYIKPASNFVYDISPNANTLDSFVETLSVTNLLTDVTAPQVQNTSATFVDKNGFDIYVAFKENSSPPLLPATGIQGFRVFVNGVASPIKTAISLNTISQNNAVKLSLYNKIYKNDVVTLGYIKSSPTTLNSLRDSSGNYVESFSPFQITNTTLDNAFGFFDPLEWDANISLGLGGGGNSGSGTISTVGNNDNFFDSFQEIFSKEERYPGASVILDTHPPYGTVIINRNETADDPGIKIHEFSVFGDATDFSTISDYTLSHLLQGWRYNSPTDQIISQVSFKLKKAGTIFNSADKVEFLLYSGDEPGTLVGKIGEIIYNDLADTYKTFTFKPSTTLSLSGSNNYWFVISLSTLPISTSGTAQIYAAKVTETDGILAYYDSTSGKWIKSLGVSGYVKISSSNINGEPISGRDLMLDILENPIREAISFGGSSDETAYEIIGDKQFNYVLKKLNKITNASGNLEYPTVVNVVIGAKSSLPKNYSLEVKETLDSEWINVFDTISDEDTNEFLDYKFEEPKQLAQLRIAYRGDYFSIDKTGTLTLAVRDDLSNVVSAQVSHYPDFRDADEFQNADVRGFFDFRQGVTQYSNYSIANSEALWMGQDTYAGSEGLASIAFENKIIFASNNSVYYYNQTQIKEVFNSFTFADNIQVTCFATFKNQVYFGTSNGLIYSSYNGEFWTLVNPKDPLNLSLPKYIKPIKTMCASGKHLFIGTTKGSTTQSSVYTFDGKSISLLLDFDYEEITSSASYSNFIYFGMGDGPNNNNSAIYKYNNTELTKVLTSDSDSVDAICFSTAAKSIVAGLSGGQIWKLGFDSNNDATSWALWYESYADNFYSITNDVLGNYLFASTNNGIYGYVKSLDQFKLMTSYKPITPGTLVTVRGYTTYLEGFSSEPADIKNYTQIQYNSNGNVDYDDCINEEATGVSELGINVEISGFIKAESTGTYAFRVLTGLPILMYLNDSLVIDEFNDVIAIQSYDATNTVSVNEGDLIKFKIFVSYPSALFDYSLSLNWNNTSGEDGYVVVPSSQFYKSSEIKAIWNNLTSYAGVGIDGNVYNFDPSFYATKIRNVYARFKDEAGNIHGIILPGKSVPYPIITDKITQDVKTSNGLRISSGKIFQLKQNDNLVLSTRAIYTPKLSNYSVYAPDRKVNASGYWEVQPFYVPALSQWGNLTALVLNKYGVNDLEGLDAGTEVKVYVKAANSRDSLLAASYGSPYVISYINNSNVSSTLESFNVPLQTFGGKWLQYKIELVTATKNLSPELAAVTVTYTAATGSFFYTKMFDASTYSPDVIAPKFRRGLLTSNDLPNGGTITYGYTIDDDSAYTYDFSKYTVIEPNKTFELSTPSSKIRFAIMFTAVGATPSVVYDWAVQLDAGSADMKMMPGL